MITQDEAILILRKSAESCKNIFGSIDEAYLYGSYARGDYHEESDVDILITVDLQQKEISHYHWEIACLSSDLSLEYDVTVSIIVKSSEQFNKYRSFLPYYQNVINEGIRYSSATNSQQ